MENPYRDISSGPPPGEDVEQPPRSRLVSQVRIVALLMGVQGGLEIVLGFLLGCMGGMLPLSTAMMKSSGEPVPYNDGFVTFMTVFYLAIATIHLAAGVVHLYAAVVTYRFRGRKWGIAALVVGLLTAVFVLCLPTALALAIYGLIVYVNEAVVRAFEMGSRGVATHDILAACGEQAATSSTTSPK